MSSTITKVEESHKTTRQFRTETIVYKTNQVFGIMDHGYFGISYSHSSHALPQDRNDYTAFYATSAELPRTLSSDGQYAGGQFEVLNLAGARWAGDALGIQISSETPVFGSAALTIIDGYEHVFEPLLGYLLRVNVQWNNGDNIQVDGAIDHSYRHTFNGDYLIDIGIEVTDGYFIQGAFAGSQAEEAFGSFETPDYVGSFGVERQ